MGIGYNIWVGMFLKVSGTGICEWLSKESTSMQTILLKDSMTNFGQWYFLLVKELYDGS